MFEVTHDSGEEGFPDCPNCSKVLEWRPQRFATTGVKSKAIDLAQEVMEKDYGLSNYRDNNREGDVGYIDPLRKTAAELDQAGQRASEAAQEVAARVATVSPEHKQAVDAFFGGQSVRIGQNSIPASQMIQAGKMGPGAEVNPMAALHKLGKEGKLPNNFTLMGTRDKL